MEESESKARVVLYTKPGCHLCDEMKGEVARAGCSEIFTLAEIDIESDPALLERYQYDIPVLTINDVEVFRHRLTADEFRVRLIRSYNGLPAR